MTRDDAMAGTMGRVGKRRVERVVCAVDACERVAVYVIHIEMGVPRVPGISVPMCRDHGDYALPGPLRDWDERGAGTANEETGEAVLP